MSRFLYSRFGKMSSHTTDICFVLFSPRISTCTVERGSTVLHDGNFPFEYASAIFVNQAALPKFIPYLNFAMCSNRLPYIQYLLLGYQIKSEIEFEQKVVFEK